MSRYTRFSGEDEGLVLTLRKTSCVVYAFSFFVIALLSASGEIGNVSMKEVVDWVLAAWLSGYASIVILLIGGTVHTAFKEIKNLQCKYKRRGVKC